MPHPVKCVYTELFSQKTAFHKVCFHGMSSNKKNEKTQILNIILTKKGMHLSLG